MINAHFEMLALRVECYKLLTLMVLAIVKTRDVDSLGNHPIIVIGLIEEKAELPCYITDIQMVDAPTLVFWYKDNITKPIYTLDARRRSLVRARHSSVFMTSRVRFVTHTRPALLMFSSLHRDDQGSYRCRADFIHARTRYTDSILKVIEPPSKPVIKDRNGKILRSLIGPYNEGDSLLVICEVEGGIPSLNVSWWRESVLLDDTFKIVGTGIVTNELLIPSLQRHDLMAAYTCRVSIYNLTSSLSSTVTVDMNFRPLAVRIEKIQAILKPGKMTKLECQAFGSRPAAVVTWWKDGRNLRNVKSSISVDGNVTTSTLTFKPSILDNDKTLICKAQNPLIKNFVLKDGIKLNVYFAPMVNIISSDDWNNTLVKKGHEVVFDCQIQANPWVTAVYWIFEHRELRSNISSGIIIKNNNLVLQKVDAAQRGHYICKAVNSEGIGESKPVRLRIEYAPVCKPDQRVLYRTGVHEPVQVLCEVDADPEQVRFRWLFNNSCGSREVQTFQEELTRSTATFIPQNHEDYGTLTCWGSNRAGTQIKPCLYRVKAVELPAMPANCTVKNVTTNSVEIGCLEGYSGGSSQEFVLEIREDNMAKKYRKLTAKKPLFSIKGLSNSRRFQVYVYAVNAKGKSPEWKNIITTLSPSVEDEGSSGLWNTQIRPILVTGAAGILFVLAFIVFFVKLQLRIRRGKRHSGKPFAQADTIHENNSQKASEEPYSPVSIVEDERGPDIIPGKFSSNYKSQN
ncbi:neural cell adhesion molecule 1-like [Tachypleus tridentatus]|uniref:neural cell adhesion molecule 1-like n=1 Tax=Tachypleus tridentatus TaxID=6853 RepID=UPI003FD0D492